MRLLLNTLLLVELGKSVSFFGGGIFIPRVPNPEWGGAMTKGPGRET